jgi:hypothetical protein
MQQRFGPLVALLSTAVLIIVTAGLLDFWVDPYGVYRKDNACLSAPCVPWDYLDYLVATYLPADSAIVGSSLTMHSDLRRSAEAAGERLINLSGLGNTGPQQELMVQRTIERHHPRTIYWEIFANVARTKQPFTSNFPRFAYDNSILNDYPYLLSIDTLTSSVRTLLGIRQPRFAPEDLQDYHDCSYCSFGIDHVRASLPQIVKAFDLYLDINPWRPEAIKAALDEDILPVVQEHPEVHFVFFFPPVSIYMILEYDRRLQAIGHSFIEIKRTIASALLNRPNVTVVDLQDVGEMVTDFNHYYDIMHYSADVNVWIVQELKSGSRNINSKNLNQKLDSLTHLIDLNRTVYEAFRAEALAARWP